MNYLVIGGGRLAQHMSHYLKLLELDFTQWQRAQNSLEDLNAKIKNSDVLLLCISDSSIEEFYNQHCVQSHNISVHFSGSLSIPGIYSAHPLMSFGPTMYTLAEYERIPFITEKSQPKLNEILPNFKNPSFAIDSSNKPLYHAICALMVNLPQILWSKGSENLGKQIGLPKEVFLPILKKALENFMLHGSQSVTGAIVRQDEALMRSHIQQLEKIGLSETYISLAKQYLNSNGEKSVHRDL